MKLLLNKDGIDYYQANKNNKTPFFVVCYYNCLERIELLLNKERINCNQADIKGETPFYFLFAEMYNDRIAFNEDLEVRKKQWLHTLFSFDSMKTMIRSKQQFIQYCEEQKKTVEGDDLTKNDL